MIGKNILEQEDIDRVLLSLDGTENKNVLGAGAIYSVSAAAAETERVRTAAKEEMRQEIQTPPLSEKDQSLFLSEEMKQSESMPVRALTVDLWGEERAAQLIQRARQIQEQAGAQRQEQTQVQA